MKAIVKLAGRATNYLFTAGETKREEHQHEILEWREEEPNGECADQVIDSHLLMNRPRLILPAALAPFGEFRVWSALIAIPHTQ